MASGNQSKAMWRCCAEIDYGMKKANNILLLLFLLVVASGRAQLFEFGMETVTGPAHTTFRGDLAKLAGFSELTITRGQVDTALLNIGIDAPRWLRDLYPGVRIQIDQEINRKMTRNISGVRFYGHLKWIGGSFTVSDPRLTQPQESRKLKNQIKAIRLSLAGDAEALSEHLALMALADVNRVNPFFAKRYDLDAYVCLDKFIMGDRPLLEWGSDNQNTIQLNLTVGMRFTADPSPAVDLGSVLFVRERLDSLMKGRLLAPVENITGAIAEGIQNVVFGRFRDPRTVPSIGWVARGELPVYFGGGFAVLGGAEWSFNSHIAARGTRPMHSIYGFAGLRWTVIGKRRR
jgi:hypothetical protein